MPLNLESRGAQHNWLFFVLLLINEHVNCLISKIFKPIICTCLQKNVFCDHWLIVQSGNDVVVMRLWGKMLKKIPINVRFYQILITKFSSVIWQNIMQPDASWNTENIRTLGKCPTLGFALSWMFYLRFLYFSALRLSAGCICMTALYDRAYKWNMPYNTAR